MFDHIFISSEPSLAHSFLQPEPQLKADAKPNTTNVCYDKHLDVK